MDIDSYFRLLEDEFQKAYVVASGAKSKGFDPEDHVEIRAAPDLAGKVEGLMNVKGLAEIITNNQKGRTRAELAFCLVKEVCTNPLFDDYEVMRRIELAVRTGLAIMTEGILVAPTEGVQGIGHFRNQDNSDYISIFYAGPIRSAGGTAVALSVALADYARKFFNIGAYRATQDEIERYLEEVELYHERVVNLQYKPTPDELKTVVSNLAVCVDGLPTEQIEVNVHANLSRRQFDGKEVAITNRVRGGVPLVLSSIVQKAKSVFKEVKKSDLDWNWMNGIITVAKKASSEPEKDKVATFLEELVAGRPIFAYPKHVGGFRLRYGRSRTTGIAAKGFSPATAILTMEYIGIGTQLKVEFPGKGCVAAPVDTIEGPFVKLKSGEALRVNDAETARLLKDEVAEIISLGDILITYGDFRKTNTPLQPSSYVEEFWNAQLNAAAKEEVRVDHASLSFRDAFGLSQKYGVPIHPRFLYEFQAVGKDDLQSLARAVLSAKAPDAGNLFEVSAIELDAAAPGAKRTLELLNVPHKLKEGKVLVSGGHAQSLLASLGFSGSGGELALTAESLGRYGGDYDSTIALANALAPFRIMKRSTFVGARIGRPEKARERLMVPAPHVLFPIGEFGGKERNLSNAYSYDSNKFGKQSINVEIAKYRCASCGLLLDGPYCYVCSRHASIERTCPKCNTSQAEEKCGRCGSETVAYGYKNIDFVRLVASANAKLGVSKMPKLIKGVKSLMNRDRVAEPLEKGILRAMHNIYIFKDGTSRFDATDQPLTHFYPREMGVSVEKLRELGYEKDVDGKDLASDDQLVELRHQDVILNKRGAEYLLNVAKCMDDMLVMLYGMEPFYNAFSAQDLVGKLVLTLAPHTSCAVLNRVVGFTDANVGFAHPYTICARRRNCDGDEDTTMLLLDALINYSKAYLPTNIGGTMDEPLLLATRVAPEEVDDEVHAMEVVGAYTLEFYEKTLAGSPPSEAKMELVENRLGSKSIYDNLRFTHEAGITAIKLAPKKSYYTQLKTMDEKIEAEFRFMDMLNSIDKRDAAKRLIMSHFIPDLIGNLHSYPKQRFRCVSCNAKFRRVPLSGKCTRDGGKLLLTISKGSIEKYLETATKLADRYDLDTYMKQRIMLIRDEIDSVFGSLELNVEANQGQFNLANFL